MSMPKTAIHIAKPPSKGGNPSSQNPISWCGRTCELGTDVTIFAHRASCKRCKQLDAVYTEDLDYQRNQAKLATLRELESRA